MKVRHLRKRKPAPLIARLQGHIRRELLRLVRAAPLRNDAVGRAQAENVVQRCVREHLERVGPPPGWRRVQS